MRYALVLLLAALVPVAAQTLPPGSGFTWETLGAPPFDTYFLTVAPGGAYWGNGVTPEHPRGVYYYDEARNAWADTTDLLLVDNLAFLGPDTLVALGSGDVMRSTDGGRTWEATYRTGHNILHVAPLALPRSGGRIFVKARGGDEGLAYSTDRGRRFRTAAYDPDLFGVEFIPVYSAYVLTRGPHAGHVLQGGIGGIALSDDGGESYRPSTLWVPYRYGAYDFCEVEGPGGQHRVLAQVTDATLPYGRVSYSDDGGETWSEPVALVEPADGISYGRGELVSLGPVGQPRSALAVMARGHVYRTDDGAETWTLIGRAPVARSSESVREALVDAEGRLVVAAPHNAGPVNGVFRTVGSVAVAREAEPPPTGDLALRVEPNPSTSQAAVRWRQPSAGSARVSVFDARGREVLVVAEGHRPAGEQRAEVDTSGLAPGVYIVRAVSPEGTASARLVVAR